MSEKRTLQGIFDSMSPPRRDTPRLGTPAVDLSAPPEDRDGASPAAPEEPGTGTPESAKPAFDPYKFQVLTVSPTLRQELLGAKLARLDPEFLHDTLPPGRLTATDAGSLTPPVGESVEAPPATPSRRRRAGLALLLALGAALVVAGLLVGGRSPESAQGSPVAATAPTESTRSLAAAAVGAQPLSAGLARAPAPSPELPIAPPSSSGSLSEPGSPRLDAPREPRPRTTAAEKDGRRGDEPKSASARKSGNAPPSPSTPASAGAAHSGKSFWTEPR
jgi:hypothetical protein